MSAHFNSARATMTVALAFLVFPCGCRSLAGPPGFGPFGKSEPNEIEGRVADTSNNKPEIRQVSAESSIDESSNDNGDLVTKTVKDESITAKSKKTARSITNFVTGREQEDRNRAKTLYQSGDATFRQAAGQSGEQRKKQFAKAAKQFQKSAEAAPGSAIEQDAMYMQAESLFFADSLSSATEAYQKLQKNHPRNRHNDKIAARLFSISRYWIDTVKSPDKSWSPINLTDASLPRIDTDGHAIRVLDQIRYDDPTGRLADDATMAAAAEYIRQEKFEQADEFLTDLRETFTDSEHLFLAHLLGIRTKLAIYDGPRYSGLVLEEAQKLVKQTRSRFPDKMAETKYADMVARAAAEISFHRADRLAYRAEYREKRKEYGSAAFYYQRLLEEYGDTPHAEKARSRLAEIKSLPPIPTPRLSFLKAVFPDPRSANPLEMAGAGGDDEAGSESSETESSGTMLR